MESPRSEKATQTVRLFDAVSDSYDAVGVEFFGPIADELVGHLAPTPGESLLDIGCGTGQVLMRAAKLVGETGRMMGIDASPGMISQARATLDEAGLTRVELREADAQDLEPANGQFDIVASSLVLFFIPEPLRALRSWRTVLNPGGRIGITTFGARDPRWEAVDSVFTSYLPPGMLDARTTGAKGPFASDDGVAELIAKAGSTNAHTWNTDIDVAFEDAAHWHSWTMSVGQRAMWQAVPAEDVAAVLDLAAQRLSECVGNDGRIHLTQTIRTTVAWHADAIES